MSSDPTNNRPIWEAESSYPELCQTLTEALKEVLDPELGLSVIQLGLVRDVKIEADRAEMRMIL
ncbi:MAG: iron-sulfur cluster assembly protein, partial [Anaerolineaceae bacterium]|nr:iron-sulfur cluster assembly protein [Anaerolineaceae bacterium]